MIQKPQKYYILIAAIFCLLAGSLFYVSFVVPGQAAVDYTAGIQQRITHELKLLNRQLAPVLESIAGKERVRFSDFKKQSDYPFYVFKEGKLVYWSDHRFVPDYRYLEGDDTLKVVHELRQDYIARKWTVPALEVEVFGILPLSHNYKIDNNYLRSGLNERIFKSQDIKLLSPGTEEAGFCIPVAEESCFLKVAFDEQFSPQRQWANLLTLLFFVAAIILLLVWLADKGLWLWAVSFYAIREVMLYFNFPTVLIDLPLFDSVYFASSRFNPSMGDLLINLCGLLFVVVYFFRHYHGAVLTRRLLRLQGWWRQGAAVLLSLMALLGYYFQFLVIRTIYHNSELSYDITQTIQFDLNRIAIFLIYIISGIMAFLVFHICFRLVRKLLGAKRYTAFYIGNIGRFRYATFLYLFSGIIVSAMIGATVLNTFENEREVAKKSKYARQFLIENDNLAEYLLAEANDKIKEDLFIQNRLTSPFLSKDIIRAKIKQVYLSNYFDKYDVKIYLYNVSGSLLEEGVTEPAEAVPVNEFKLEPYLTGYPGIYFVNEPGMGFSKRYLDFIEIKRRGGVVGHIVLDLTLKKIIPQNVYPELLVDNRFLVPYQHANYSSAVFASGDIIYNSGDYNYVVDFDTTWLANPALYTGGIDAYGYSHIAFKDQEGNQVVISAPEGGVIKVMSNFSFLFLVGVFVLLLFITAGAVTFSLRRVTLSYSARIQLYLNIAFFLPLFAVSITTLSQINASFKEELSDTYKQKAETISSNVSDELEDYLQNKGMGKEELATRLSAIAKYAGADVNLFSTKGKLIATSQPLIYENDILSTYLYPMAYAKIKEQGKLVYIGREEVGTLAYNTTFYGVKSFESGGLIGILSIPFFQSAYALEQNQISVLSNVINIFTFIFITSLILSFFVARSLTFPLTFITQKLKKTTLTGFNEPLAWHADDEIGLMVGEYNRMLVNLEESKKELARFEKESAWRDIAQQVAHEIKNPLTPMKLTLQHLRRQLHDKQEQGMQKPIDSLLQQIETLNDITSSFSTFARMPLPADEVYEFTEVLRKTVQLHQTTENTEIHLHIPEGEVYTRGDKQLMGRIISNIIINAVQAKQEGGAVITVNLVTDAAHKLLLEISDNGPGIEEAIHGKIFIPNFSTKETGSGIGLAIAKHGIEHAGGKIWFETEVGKGTSFFIELKVKN